MISPSTGANTAEGALCFLKGFHMLAIQPDFDAEWGRWSSRYGRADAGLVLTSRNRRRAACSETGVACRCSGAPRRCAWQAPSC